MDEKQAFAIARSSVARWCKEREIEALEAASNLRDDGIQYGYWSGKAEAFSNVWEWLVFNGKAPSPQAYNKANDAWSATLADVDGDKAGE